MTKEYPHEIKREFQSISGKYILEKEERIEVDGKVVLYAVGNAIVDSSCCGVGGCRYALVPGYVQRFKTRKNERGLWVSEVEPIVDGKSRREITQLLKQKEWVTQVQFWG
ncbi:MAG: hypothetical protein JRJ11_13500 [Deltaproteobacteria bacterium]|jgi:hypothetical protein|nr:hypothetical protein [Deltaproteobacteria bacterium]MBW2170269.1 hypothetical protein [Deltaproteobacteria bacterium]